MQKEVILAIIFGSLLGIIVAFGIWKANSSFNSQPEQQKKTEEQQQEDADQIVQDNDQTSLVISKPENYAVLESEELKIEGITKSNSYILLINDDDFSLSQADNDGSFNIGSILSAGINNLNIFALSPNSAQQKNTLTLVFTTELDGTRDSEEASDSATLDDKVNEKLAKASNLPTSYIGTVTDITEGSFQIRDENDEIKQISIDNASTYVNIVKTTKDIDFSELAIGDYVAALGYKSENEILLAKRVLVTTARAETDYTVQLGKIVDINSSAVEITTGPENFNYTITNDTKLRQYDQEDDNLTKISSTIFDENDLAIIISQKDEDGDSTLLGVIRLTVDSEE